MPDMVGTVVFEDLAAAFESFRGLLFAFEYALLAAFIVLFALGCLAIAVNFRLDTWMICKKCGHSRGEHRSTPCFGMDDGIRCGCANPHGSSAYYLSKNRKERK